MARAGLPSALLGRSVAGDVCGGTWLGAPVGEGGGWRVLFSFSPAMRGWRRAQKGRPGRVCATEMCPKPCPAAAVADTHARRRGGVAGHGGGRCCTLAYLLLLWCRRVPDALLWVWLCCAVGWVGREWGAANFLMAIGALRRKACTILFIPNSLLLLQHSTARQN